MRELVGINSSHTSHLAFFSNKMFEQCHRIRRPIVPRNKVLHNRKIEKFVTIIIEMNK